MKKIFKLFYVLFLFIPIFVDARVNYDDAKSYTNNYIYGFDKYRDYILLRDKLEYVYENGAFSYNSDFKSGGFLSKSEYEISNIKGNTYLSNGLEYWTLTQSSNSRHYIINYKLEEMLDTNLSGVRITEYVQNGVTIHGKGTYGDPWKFAEVFSIHIASDSSFQGKVSTVDCSNESMKKDSISLSLVAGGKKEFYVCPESGFRVFKNSCYKYITGVGGTNKFVVENLDKDNLICNMSFTYKTSKVTINGCTSCSTGKTYDPLYANEVHKLWFTDSDGLNQITKLSVLPSKTGYTFKGFYSSSTDVSDDNKIIDENGNLLYNSQLANDVDVYPYMKANEYTVTFDANGGTNLSTSTLKVTYDQRYDKNDVLASVTRGGYKFEGWYTATSGGTKVTADTIVKITGNQTLYARWTQCSAGTYSLSDSSSCATCTVGSYSLAGASECSSCPSEYTSEAGANAQNKCYINVPAGKYLGTANGTSFSSCSAGYAKAAHKVYYGSTSSCTQCSAGTYSLAGAGSCTSCPGSYTSAAGAISESKCYISVGANKYIASAGSSTQTSCATGMNSSAHTVYYGNTSSCSYNTWYVKYNANGGTGTMDNSTHTYGTAKALTAKAFTRSGFTFVSWNTSADGSGSSYADKASVSNLTTTNGGTVNLYAIWRDSSNPTCILQATSSGVSFKSKNDNVAVSEYGLIKSATATYNSKTSLALSEGTFYGYVKDSAGNTGSCSITIGGTYVSKYSKTTQTCDRSIASYDKTVQTCKGTFLNYTRTTKKCNATFKNYSKTTQVCNRSVAKYKKVSKTCTKTTVWAKSTSTCGTTGKYSGTCCCRSSMYGTCTYLTASGVSSSSCTTFCTGKGYGWGQGTLSDTYGWGASSTQKDLVSCTESTPSCSSSSHSGNKKITCTSSLKYGFSAATTTYPTSCTESSIICSASTYGSANVECSEYSYNYAFGSETYELTSSCSGNSITCGSSTTGQKKVTCTKNYNYSFGTSSTDTVSSCTNNKISCGASTSGATYTSCTANYSYAMESSTSDDEASCTVSTAFNCSSSTEGQSYVSSCTTNYNYAMSLSTSTVTSCTKGSSFTCNSGNYEKSYVSDCTPTEYLCDDSSFTQINNSYCYK